MSSNVVHVTDASFESEVLNSTLPVVVDFWAEWCGPCRVIAPSLDQIGLEMAGSIKIAKLNIDENPNAAAKFGVRSIPTLMIFRNGEQAAVKIGAAAKNELSNWIKSNS